MNHIASAIDTLAASSLRRHAWLLRAGAIAKAMNEQASQETGVQPKKRAGEMR